MNLFRTFLRRIKYNLTYLFGSRINIPSEFRLFERRKTNYEAFINKHCRLTSNNKVKYCLPLFDYIHSLDNSYSSDCLPNILKPSFKLTLFWEVNLQCLLINSS